MGMNDPEIKTQEINMDTNSNRLTREGIEALLDQFTGTENYYHRGMSFYTTDGVHFLAEAAGAHWLIDAIFSWQVHPRIRREPFQSWTLKVDLEKRSAVLVGTDGDGHQLARQQIQYTDFPLPEIKLWVELGSVDEKHTAQICLLPSEH